MTSPTPQDYLDAARASLVAENWAPDLIDRVTSYRAEKPGHVAAVDSAFAAGWRAGQVRIRAELGFLGHVAEDTDAPASKREGLRRYVELMYAALDDDGDGDQG